MQFVFVAIDRGDARRVIFEHLEAVGLPFIDVGMGVQEGADQNLAATLRTTVSTPENRDHVGGRVPLADPAQNEYDRNIQIVELNAMNAALAVIRWKKVVGFYADHRSELQSTYTTFDNHLLNFTPG